MSLQAVLCILVFFDFAIYYIVAKANVMAKSNCSIFGTNYKIFVLLYDPVSKCGYLLLVYNLIIFMTKFMIVLHVAVTRIILPAEFAASNLC